MAGLSNMMCWYVCIYDNTKKTGNMVMQKQCTSVAEANALMKEKAEEYKKPQYTITKERF
jgi:hypothetical protein